MASTTDKILYGVRQIRIKNLLSTGAEDPSATEYDVTKPQRVNWTPVYLDGEQQVHRGGDSIVALIEEDDKFIGIDFSVALASLSPEVDATICGGVATPASSKWASPISSSEDAYPFEMTIWVANYKSSDADSEQDGFIKFTLPLCKGRRDSDSNADKPFGAPSYAIRERRNESGSPVLPAITYEKVDSIV